MDLRAISGYKYKICSLFTLLIILSIFLSIEVSATGWTKSIDVGGQNWNIQRNSQTFTFELEGNVQGSVTPIEVTPSGRSIKNVVSKYSDISVNNVGAKNTVSAREGRIILQDITLLASSDENSYWGRTIYGNGLLTSEDNEEWPVIFKSNNLVRYKGLELNDLGYIENTYDRIGGNSLYNKNFAKYLSVNNSLIRFNATVRASDSIFDAELNPTKSMDYRLITNTSGITDLYSRILDSHWDSKHKIYPDSMRSLERYVGDYQINRSIQYQSSEARHGILDPWYGEDHRLGAEETPSIQGEPWLPCCLPDETLDVPQFHENLSL